jgi:hypothetical protein
MAPGGRVPHVHSTGSAFKLEARLKTVGVGVGGRWSVNEHGIDGSGDGAQAAHAQ